MRLINVRSFEIQEFSGSAVPDYAILSHTWGSAEASFGEWTKRWRRLRRLGRFGRLGKACFSKIISTCKLARQDGLSYAWVDTVCIDKSSSAELSEAINSMFEFYRGAKVCYIYLSDVPSQPGDKVDVLDLMRACRWFTRGWTLQELLAPAHAVFYSQDWVPLGTKKALAAMISDVTGIDRACLYHSQSLSEYSIAERMAWAANRSTTREEDLAYCLLGIFGINMPLLYGEGRKAFRRLQEEIIKVSDDHSILAFDTNMSEETLFAHHPKVFSRGRQIHPYSTPRITSPFAMTNAGLSLTTPLIQTLSPFWVLAVLNCHEVDVSQNTRRSQICLPLFGKDNRYMRARLPVSIINKCMEEPATHIRDDMPDLTPRKESTYLVSYFSRVYSAYGTEMDVALKGFEIGSSLAAGFMITFPRGLAGYQLACAYPQQDIRADISFFTPSDPDYERQPGGILVFKDESVQPPRQVAVYLALELDAHQGILLDWVCKLIPVDKKIYEANFANRMLARLQQEYQSGLLSALDKHYSRLDNAIVSATTRFPTLAGEPCVEAVMVELAFDAEALFEERDIWPVQLLRG